MNRSLRDADDDGRPTDLQPLRRDGSRGPAVLTGIVVVVVLLAVMKPWNWGGGASPVPTRGAPVVTAVATPSPTTPVSDVFAPVVKPTPSGEGLIECLRFDAWRLLTISRSQGSLVRTWTAMTPQGAAGPDAVKDYVPVSDGSVLNVGYCGPVALLPGDAASVVVTGWRSTGATGSPVPIGVLEPAFTSASASRALFRRPATAGSGASVSPSLGASGAPRSTPRSSAVASADQSDAWQPGLYAFHLVAAGPNPLDLWFGVEIAGVRR